MTTTQQFANDVNAVLPLPKLPTANDWHVVGGKVKKTYFERSPYASIDACDNGFVVHNHVTGTAHPCRSWAKAKDLRASLSARYQVISRGCR